MHENIPIISQDHCLIAVDKPAGMLTVPTPKKESYTLLGILNSQLRQDESSPKIHPCHRLDRETSGVIVFAKGKSSQQKIMAQFHESKVEKKYIAFVQGRLKKPQGVINFPLEGKKAITKYKVISFDCRNFSVVEIQTLTGRTNQIRIHFKMIGHPLVGERKFAFGRDFALKFRRAALHASSLQITHPVSGKILKFQAPLAPDMVKLLKGEMP